MPCKNIKKFENTGPQTQSWFSPSMQVQNVTAEYIMKCDDDTFVRVDSVLEEVQATSIGEGLYLGSMNEFHRPLRTGKWAVTFEVFSVKTHLVCVSSILLILFLR